MKTQKKSNSKPTIDGVLVIEPDVFNDERGFFYESYNQTKLKEIGISTIFVQDNHSFSKNGVLRGLHVQIDPPQDKLIRVIDGKIFDVVVDLRIGSKTFGNVFYLILSGKNRKQIYIPGGCAHGFLVISKNATVSYKVSNFWKKDKEYGIIWNDPDINIPWPLDSVNKLILSDKDQNNISIKKYIESISQ